MATLADLETIVHEYFLRSSGLSATDLQNTHLLTPVGFWPKASASLDSLPKDKDGIIHLHLRKVLMQPRYVD